jgi:hypothetical protein
MVESIWTSQSMLPAASAWAWICMQGPREHPVQGVAAEAGVHGLPQPVAFRQVTPGDPGTDLVDHPLDDTKNEMKRSIDGLGTRVNDLERDLRAALTTETAGLRDTALADVKSSQHETRTSAYNAGKRASEAVAAVVDLRRDVDRLRDGLDGSRGDIRKILEAVQAASPARVPVTVGSAEDPFLNGPTRLLGLLGIPAYAGLPVGAVEGTVGIGHTDLEFATGVRPVAIVSVS